MEGRDGLCAKAINIASEWIVPCFVASSLSRSWGSILIQASSESGFKPPVIVSLRVSKLVCGKWFWPGSGDWGRSDAICTSFQLHSGENIRLAWWWRIFAEDIQDVTRSTERHRFAKAGSLISSSRFSSTVSLIWMRLTSIPLAILFVEQRSIIIHEWTIYIDIYNMVSATSHSARPSQY